MNPTAATTEANRRHVIIALNRCIELSTDAEKGYALAAADVRDPTLKTKFLSRVKERSDFVLELQEAIRKMQASPENEGSVKGALHRAFMSLERVVEGRDDKRILQGCIRGEQLALQGYTSAIGRARFDAWPGDLHAMIERQYWTIQRSLDELRGSVAV